MGGLEPFGRLLLIAGLAIAAIGLMLVLGIRLPGDLRIDRGNVTIVIPIGTMIVLSIVLTILLNVLGGRR